MKTVPRLFKYFSLYFFQHFKGQKTGQIPSKPLHLYVITRELMKSSCHTYCHHDTGQMSRAKSQLLRKSRENVGVKRNVLFSTELAETCAQTDSILLLIFRFQAMLTGSV